MNNKPRVYTTSYCMSLTKELNTVFRQYCKDNYIKPATFLREILVKELRAKEIIE